MDEMLPSPSPARIKYSVSITVALSLFWMEFPSTPCVLLLMLMTHMFVCGTQAMVGTGEALLNIRAKGGPAVQADGKGTTASVPTAQEFDFQSELQKFDKVNGGGRTSGRVQNT